MPFTTGDNNYSVAKWQVNPTAGLGTHTTIATALTSASSGDTIFIMPSTYTENLTLKAGVNLVAFVPDGNTPNVTIVGKLSCSYSGTACISGIRLQTNSDNAIALTGANATVLRLFNCYLNFTNADGISSTGSNAAAGVFLNECVGDLGTTGIKLFNVTNGGLEFIRVRTTNSGGSSTASTFSGGQATFRWVDLLSPYTTSGSTALISMFWTNIDTSAQTVSAFNSNSTAGPPASIIIDSRFVSGTATPITIGASSSVVATNVTLDSTNAAGISGLGNLKYNYISQVNVIGSLTPTTVSTGYIGEVLSASNTSGNALSSGTTNNVSSLTLTPGIWDITGTVNFIPTGANTVTYAVMAISLANNNSTPADNFGSGIGMLQSQISGAVVTVANGTNLLCGPGRLVVTANTTYFLNATLTGSVVNTKAYGVIRAIRMQ